MKKTIAIISLLVISIIMATSPCFAEGDHGWFEAVDESSEAAEKKGKGIGDRIVIAPIPMVNPTLEAGIIGVAMYMHPETDFWNDEPDDDEVTRQSITGAAAMATTNQSWMVGAFHKGFYDDDRYRGQVFLAYGEFNLKFYGVGDDSILRDNPIKYKAEITALQPQFFFKIADNWFIGPKYSIFQWGLGINFSSIHDALPNIERTITTAGFGLAGEWDTTDHSVYATKGGKFQFSALDYGSIWGSDFDYFKWTNNYNHYFPLAEKTVLATRADLNFSNGDIPFFDMPFLHLRGFPFAQYIDKQSASIQADIRHRFTKKWSASIFGGLGWIANEPRYLFKGETIPTGGFGINYLIAEEQKMNLRMDIAFGPNSKALYFSVGEWF